MLGLRLPPLSPRPREILRDLSRLVPVEAKGSVITLLQVLSVTDPFDLAGFFAGVFAGVFALFALLAEDWLIFGLVFKHFDFKHLISRVDFKHFAQAPLLVPPHGIQDSSIRNPVSLHFS